MTNNGKSPWDPKDQPPDLDQIVEEWQKRFNTLFGGSSSGSSQKKGPPATLLIVLGLFLWILTGLYQIDDSERGVVLRFGEYNQTTTPGLRWHIPWPIESVEIVNVNVVNRFKQQTTMLTSDENIIVVDLVVQYRKTNPVDYLFNVRDPEETLSEVSESAIREVAGKTDLDFILTEGRSSIAIQTQSVIQNTLDEYGTGISVTQVALQDANFPVQVENAVQDAIKAREDKERYAFEAEAYANDIVPKARGDAAQMIQEAEGYKAKVIADSEGEAERFSKLLVEYQKAPEVTRERLYIDAIESVYGNSNKVLMDSDGSGNLMYLPIDKLLQQNSSRKDSSVNTDTQSNRDNPTTTTQDPRMRRVRSVSYTHLTLPTKA